MAHVTRASRLPSACLRRWKDVHGTPHESAGPFTYVLLESQHSPSLAPSPGTKVPYRHSGIALHCDIQSARSGCRFWLPPPRKKGKVASCLLWLTTTMLEPSSPVSHLGHGQPSRHGARFSQMSSGGEQSPHDCSAHDFACSRAAQSASGSAPA